MRTLPKIIGLMLLYLSAVPAFSQSEDERDIRAIGSQLQQAWNKADAKMLADLFLTDGDYVSSTGRTARGRAEVEKAFQQRREAVLASMDEEGRRRAVETAASSGYWLAELRVNG